MFSECKIIDLNIYVLISSLLEYLGDSIVFVCCVHLFFLSALPPSARRHVPFELVLGPFGEDSLSFKILHQYNPKS